MPLVWLDLAARSPTLAVCLRDAVNSLRSNQTNWRHPFLHRPDWRQVARAVESAVKKDDEIKRLRLAHVALLEARTLQLPEPWTIFWDTMTADRLIDPLSELSLRLADFEFDRNVDQSIAGAFHDMLRFDALAVARGIDDPSAWLRECFELSVEEPWDWDGPIRHMLLSAAWKFAESQAQARMELLRRLERAPSLPKAAMAAADLLDERCTDFFAIWIGSGSSGAGACAAWLGPRRSQFAGRNPDFEMLLPHSARTSVRFRFGKDGNAAAYFAEPGDACVFQNSALPEMVEALAVMRCADSAPAAAVDVAVPDHLLDDLDLRYAAMVSEFAAGAGHEINNPLGAIRGKADWLLKSEFDPARRQALRKICEQVERIGAMIRDLRLLGSGELPIFADFDAAPFIESAVAAAAAARPGVDFEFTHSQSPAMMRGASELVERAVFELARNAAEAAGPGGSVSVSTVVSPEWLRIEINDSGPGFSPAVRPRALGPFYSGREAGRGLGMGLSVVRKIADLHRGKLILGLCRPTRVLLEFPLADA